MSAVKILRLARGILAEPGAHTTNALARDAEGNWCKFDDPQAVSWNGQGAIRLAAKLLGVSENSKDYSDAILFIHWGLPRGRAKAHLWDWEMLPEIGQADLLASFQRAIVYLETRKA